MMRQREGGVLGGPGGRPVGDVACSLPDQPPACLQFKSSSSLGELLGSVGRRMGQVTVATARQRCLPIDSGCVRLLADRGCLGLGQVDMGDG